MIKIDVSKSDSIESAFKEVSSFLSGKSKPLYLSGLVNNAGVFQNVSAETLMDVNVSAVYNVSEKFSSLLTDDSRIVNMSSMLGPSFVAKCNKDTKKLITNSNISWEEINNIVLGVKEDPQTTLNEMGVKGTVTQNSLYGLSKALCNSITLLHARKLNNMKVNSCHPGFIYSDMTKHYVNGKASQAKSYGMQTTEEATVAPFYLLTKANTTGNYYDNNGKVASML